MTEAKHTPGPWVADGTVIEPFNAPIGDDIAVTSHSLISRLPGPESEIAQANARLIAAAPDLLAALERLVAYGDTYRYRPEDGNPYEQARAALARARGEEVGTNG